MADRILQIRTRQVPAAGASISGEVTAAELKLVPEARIKCLEPLKFNLSLQIVSGGLLVRGKLELPAVCACDRCLAEYNTTFRVDDFCHLCEIVNQDACLDLTPHVREDILLAFPQRLLCRDGCPGLCPDCGMRLEDTACSCAADKKVDSIWNCLENLEKKNGSTTE